MAFDAKHVSVPAHAPPLAIPICVSTFRRPDGRIYPVAIAQCLGVVGHIDVNMAGGVDDIAFETRPSSPQSPVLV